MKDNDAEIPLDAVSEETASNGIRTWKFGLMTNLNFLSMLDMQLLKGIRFWAYKENVCLQGL